MMILADLGADKAFDTIISETGLIGALFVLVVIGLIWRDRQLSTERAERLKDAKYFAEIVQENTIAQREAITAKTEQTRAIAHLSEKVEQLSGHVEARK